MSEAASRPKAERKSFVPRHDDSDEGSDHGIHMTNSSPTRSRPPSSAPSAPLISAPTKVPQCKALYDFEPGMSRVSYVFSMTTAVSTSSSSQFKSLITCFYICGK